MFENDIISRMHDINIRMADSFSNSINQAECRDAEKGYGM